MAPELVSSVVADVARVLEVPPSSVTVTLALDNQSTTTSGPSNLVRMEITLNRLNNTMEQQNVDGIFEFVVERDPEMSWLHTTQQTLALESGASWSSPPPSFSLVSASAVADTTTAPPPTPTLASGFSCSNQIGPCAGIIAGGVIVLAGLILLVVRSRRDGEAGGRMRKLTLQPFKLGEEFCSGDNDPHENSTVQRVAEDNTKHFSRFNVGTQELDQIQQDIERDVQQLYNNL